MLSCICNLNTDSTKTDYTQSLALDFTACEAKAFAEALKLCGIPQKPGMTEVYSAYNDRCWKELERGELTREQVLLERFVCLFREEHIPADPAACQAAYEDFLCVGHYFIEGAEDLLAYLAPKYRLYLASNGTAGSRRAA